ncbi:hypothetical protein T484DRAFT_1622582, partial [Baffinella frigidus]
LHPLPSTLNPTPSTFYLTPSTLYPSPLPSTLYPLPSTFNPEPLTIILLFHVHNGASHTPHPAHCIINPKLWLRDMNPGGRKLMRDVTRRGS